MENQQNKQRQYDPNKTATNVFVTVTLFAAGSLFIFGMMAGYKFKEWTTKHVVNEENQEKTEEEYIDANFEEI